jgi:hypothetical protein
MTANLNGPDPKEKMRELLDPMSFTNRCVKDLIRFCWHFLVPPDRKTIDELEKQLHFLIDRAVKDLREDPESLGLNKNA